MLGGRVKTLHPRIHAGILARREVEDDLAALAEHGIEPFDLVCVNLYPFEQVAREHGVREEEAVEMIDVGGPSMLRGAAKNFAHVAPVCRPRGLRARAGRAARDGELSLETRRRLAATAFATRPPTTPRSRPGSPAGEPFPPRLRPRLREAARPRLRREPAPGAAYYAERGARTHLLARVEQLHGRELSFNNLNDLNAARLLVREFALPACVIVKHANPCGVARRRDDRGGVRARARGRPGLGLRRRRRPQPRRSAPRSASALAEQFVEVLFAPGYDEVGGRGARPQAGDRGS